MTREHSRAGLRQRLMDPESRSVLLADLSVSIENQDKYTRVNHGGLGRIRRFTGQSMYMNTGRGVVSPRKVFRTIQECELFDTQVFQLGGCNWFCWYCFVDDAILDAQSDVTRMTSVHDMVALYRERVESIQIIDLSGGQPELVPEWILWTMEELENQGLRGRAHIWADDNLSGTFMQSFLSREQIRYMAEFPFHSRAGCFKGMDDVSIRATTADHSASLDGQIRAVASLIECGFDPICYITLTGPWSDDVRKVCRRFINRLTQIHPMLPLKIVPLEIRNYAAVLERNALVNEPQRMAKYNALVVWEDALAERFARKQIDCVPDSICLLGGCSLHPCDGS